MNRAIFDHIVKRGETLAEQGRHGLIPLLDAVKLDPFIRDVKHYDALVKEVKQRTARFGPKIQQKAVDNIPVPLGYKP